MTIRDRFVNLNRQAFASPFERGEFKRVWKARLKLDGLVIAFCVVVIIIALIIDGVSALVRVFT